MATALDIHVDQGTDVRIPIAFIDDFSEVDLTGFEARMEIRTSASSSKVVDLLTTENGRICIVKETMTLLWSHDISKELPSGTYVYDLEIVSVTGEVTRLLSGRVKVCKEVTRWPYEATA